jgi:E3 ubiquitin-protein ligase TRIP12
MSTAGVLPDTMDLDSSTTQILELLRLLHTLMLDAKDLGSREDGLTEKLFVNNKLTAKLTRQLEETMVLAG